MTGPRIKRSQIQESKLPVHKDRLRIPGETSGAMDGLRVAIPRAFAEKDAPVTFDRVAVMDDTKIIASVEEVVVVAAVANPKTVVVGNLKTAVANRPGLSDRSWVLTVIRSLPTVSSKSLKKGLVSYARPKVILPPSRPTSS